MYLQKGHNLLVTEGFLKGPRETFSRQVDYTVQYPWIKVGKNNSWLRKTLILDLDLLTEKW
jgi:hypothetical protein